MSKATQIIASGAPEGFDARLVLDELARAGGAVIHVARDDKRLAAMQAALAFFAPDHAGADLSRLGLPAL
jgi:transcription-repair coupling factor (superfamily II helicase)